VFVSLAPSHADGEFVAGFIQAEGHFAVVEQNAGQSIACGFSLAVRDDETYLIGWLHDITELGSVHPVPARRSSAAQSSWLIQRRDDVRQLAELLTRHRMYGRKAREFALWRAAVLAWTQDPPDRDTMRLAMAQLHRIRRYAPPDALDDITVPIASDLRHYLGGLITGDGHFSLSGGSPRMVLKQRHDELPLLRALCASVGVGAVYEDHSGPGNPRATWIVFGIEQCQILSSLLRGATKGKKAAEYELWAQTIAALAVDRRAARDLALAADKTLREQRRYTAPTGRLRRPAVRRQTEWESRAALMVFAAEHAGPLGASTYMAIRQERHAEWPHRNTIARHFGSWHAALEAAGLADRAATGPERYAGRSRAVVDARLVEQRERVLASVRRFVAEVGHVPRAMEYFRWRLRHDPDTPTQATIYNLFPGGWDSVREAIYARGM
jgi:hypothetical protein